jgi:predicted transcriptional regulator of viral defense system
MNFKRLLEIVWDEPVFASDLLLAGAVDPADVQRQLSRWVQSGRIYQLRRGVYALAPPFQKDSPHPFRVANQLVRASYVSCQSALAYYNLIPEYVPATVSVTTQRPDEWQTPLGRFLYRHVKLALFFGYQARQVSSEGYAFVATPEKALLDLVYLEPNADSPAYLNELRLQNLDQLNLPLLQEFAMRSAIPKLRRATEQIAQLSEEQAALYELL